MNAHEIILDAIGRIAPDVDTAAIPYDVDFREEAELDSMDFLSVLNTVRDATGVEVPERDYAEIVSIDRFAEYLAARMTSPAP